MLVNLCYTEINPYTNRHRILFNKDEDSIRYNLNAFYENTGKYLARLYNHKNFYNHSHYRLAIHMPWYPTDILKDYLDNQINYKEYLNLSGVSFSIHAHYGFMSFSQHRYNKIKNYYANNLLLAEHFGLDNFLICTHICNKNINEAILVLHKLLYDLPTLHEHLCIENCDKTTNVQGCLRACNILKLPFIFDNFHNELNGNIDKNYYINDFIKTWNHLKFKPFIHYSNGEKNGKHGDTINFSEFFDLVNAFKNYTDELNVIIELKNAEQAIQDFKLKTSDNLNWDYISRIRI